MTTEYMLSPKVFLPWEKTSCANGRTRQQSANTKTSISQRILQLQDHVQRRLKEDGTTMG